MTDRLNAWIHWARLETPPDDDKILMARDIETLEAEKVKLRAAWESIYKTAEEYERSGMMMVPGELAAKMRELLWNPRHAATKDVK